MWITLKEASARYGITRQRLMQLMFGSEKIYKDKVYEYAAELKKGVHFRDYEGEQASNMLQKYELNQEECDIYFNNK